MTHVGVSTGRDVRAVQTMIGAVGVTAMLAACSGAESRSAASDSTPPSQPARSNDAHTGAPMKLFKELPDIQGHPAVLADLADKRSNGECGVAVGLTDDLVLNATTQLDAKSPHYSDPCGLAHDVADSATRTVRGAA